MPRLHSPRSSGRSRPAPLAEINIIPLVDVMLVLLIIFMATTAFVKDSELGLKLPQAKSGQSAAGENRDLTIIVTRTGALLLGGKPISEAALERALRARIQSEPDLRATIKGDGGVPYERVVGVMDVARQAGLKSVALGTREPDER